MLKPAQATKILMLLALSTLWVTVFTPGAFAQREGSRDEPLSFSPMEEPAAQHATGFKGFLESVCWYIPNRLMDLTDIPRFHLSSGDGMGATLRLTKWIWWSSWFEDDAYCLGWTKRTPPFWGESIHERYFGFLAAHEGELDRDPTEVGLSFHFIMVGANAALSVGEALDALVGIVGVDLAGDDHGPVMFDFAKEKEAPEQETESQAQASAQESAEGL